MTAFGGVATERMTADDAAGAPAKVSASLSCLPVRHFPNDRPEFTFCSPGVTSTLGSIKCEIRAIGPTPLGGRSGSEPILYRFDDFLACRCDTVSLRAVNEFFQFITFLLVGERIIAVDCYSSGMKVGLRPNVLGTQPRIISGEHPRLVEITTIRYSSEFVYFATTVLLVYTGNVIGIYTDHVEFQPEIEFRIYPRILGISDDERVCTRTAALEFVSCETKALDVWRAITAEDNRAGCSRIQGRDFSIDETTDLYPVIWAHCSARKGSADCKICLLRIGPRHEVFYRIG